jgi:hypothetical protein
MMSKVISPEVEHNYMLHNGKLSIALGLCLSIVSLDEVFLLSEKATVISGSFFAVAVISVFATGYFLIKSSRFAGLSLYKNIWTSTYNDEFLNTVNLVAHKLTAMSLTAAALAAMVFGNYFAEIITIKTFGKGMLALSFLSYGFVTFLKLNQYDED